MSAITHGVTIIGGKNNGSICGLDQDPPTPLTIPAGETLVFTHGTGKRAYKVNVTNLDASDPISKQPYSAFNMNCVATPGNALGITYPVGITQVETAPPGSNIYDAIGVLNASKEDLDCCIQIFWEVDSEALSLVSVEGNENPQTDVNDPRITFQDIP